ncbi:MAG: transcription antitermination factor NusB [Ekhidna sp.]|nr:transcription antitermination factor NusB [Ekhidna sp.]
MLNRRILRVKAIQALYGYFTAVESVKEIMRENLRRQHSLDPAKHDFADKALFEARKKQAVCLFNQNILAEQVSTEEDVDGDVLERVNDALLSYRNALSKEAATRKNEMMKEARNIRSSYIKLLILPIAIEQREKLDSEKEAKAYLAKSKRHYPFIGDAIVDQLKKAEILTKEVIAGAISWANELDEIKSWYREQIRPSEALAPFFEAKKEKENGNGIVLEFFKRELFRNAAIVSYLENQYLHWNENQSILKSMVVKTIKALQDGKEFAFAELTKNGEEDFKFLERLFTDVVKENDFLEEIIQERTKNWDVDRIALTDRVILKLALVEMINSPSIPLKVTINEAIEVSKQYSTPKSKQFINGVLDVLSNMLTLRGIIRKSGRGLIDNK